MCTGLDSFYSHREFVPHPKNHYHLVISFGFIALATCCRPGEPPQGKLQSTKQWSKSLLWSSSSMLVLMETSELRWTNTGPAHILV
mmetsp:Transcript_20251/g.41023  ORF Transcript_20251/g.41023 Transcript_20251/m.41023 type:complete len:86 (-) Transcript_20251:252-509(-)